MRVLPTNRELLNMLSVLPSECGSGAQLVLSTRWLASPSALVAVLGGSLSPCLTLLRLVVSAMVPIRHGPVTGLGSCSLTCADSRPLGPQIGTWITSVWPCRFYAVHRGMELLFAATCPHEPIAGPATVSTLCVRVRTLVTQRPVMLERRHPLLFLF